MYKKNNFHLLKNRLNAFYTNGKEFIYKDVRGYVKEEGNELKQRIPCEETTLRKWICWFMRAGFIERIEKGRYKMICKIPQILSSTELEHKAYPKK